MLGGKGISWAKAQSRDTSPLCIKIEGKLHSGMTALDNLVEGNIVEYSEQLEVGHRELERTPVFLIHLALHVKEKHLEN